ncbi:MAG: hemerythrin domain-containing protein [Vulcanimicrobiota bacterium]
MVVELDLRRQPPDEARRQLRHQAAALPGQASLLVRSFAPLRELVAQLEGSWTCWPLVDGPSAYFYLLSHPRQAEPALDGLREQHLEFERLYHSMVSLAVEKSTDVGVRDRFTSLLEDHLQIEERLLFPLFEEVTGDTRTTRELSYEHQGIRRGLGRLPGFLEKVVAGASKKERDAFEIDFFHLIEHHVEREEKALYPVLETLGAERLSELL